MSSGGTALLLLAGTLALAVAGGWQLVSDRTHRASLRLRAQVEPPPPLGIRLVDALEARVRRHPLGRRLSIRLAAAGIAMSPLTFLGIVGGVALVTFVLVRMIVPGWLALVFALLAARGCWAWVERKRVRRREEFVAQLPELARALSNSASAGLSVTAGLDVAIAELDDPARSELEVALQEVRIGQSLERAFDNLGERMPSRELGVLISTLAIQQRSGGDLVKALADMADTLQARKDLIREVRTLMAGSVAVAWIVLAIGPATLLLINLIKPGALDEMASKPAGVAVLVVAAVLYAVGTLLVRRITRVET